MRLLESALRYAAEAGGMRQVNLHVNADNAGAIRLYAALGFESFGTERNAMNIAGTFVDELYMVRVLARPALPQADGA
jgi:RimJ/RimL family protein N-acetyltransferase